MFSASPDCHPLSVWPWGRCCLCPMLCTGHALCLEAPPLQGPSPDGRHRAHQPVCLSIAPLTAPGVAGASVFLANSEVLEGKDPLHIHFLNLRLSEAHSKPARCAGVTLPCTVPVGDPGSGKEHSQRCAAKQGRAGQGSEPQISRPGFLG